MYRRLFAGSILAILVAVPVVAAIPSSERTALIELYESTNGPEWINSTGWLGDAGTECSWYGISCESDSVVRIEMDGNNLVGTMPTGISNLALLRDLILRNNELSGELPSGMAALSNLEVLLLDSNQISGPFPPWLTSMTSLRIVGLSANELTGLIPGEIGNLTNLIALDLFGNKFEGSIPSEIGNLTKLTSLSLHFNELTGEIPPEIGNLTQLSWLDLEANHLSGSIPDSIGNLTKLDFLDIGRNELTGPIPATVANMVSLTNLDIGECRLSGPIPDFLGTMTNLRAISLGANLMGGPIPASIGNLKELVHLWLNDNRHTGPIPAFIGELPKMTSLNLSNNELTGEIPAGLSNATDLSELVLFNNRLTGPIPYLGNMPNLEWIELWSNRLSGPFPKEIADLTKLRIVDVSNNRLISGELPSDFSKLTNLEAFASVLNQISGTIPPSLGTLPKLTELHIGGNLFSGSIPKELGNLPLNGLSLQQNQLRGEVPIEFLELQETYYLNLTDNALTASDAELAAFLEAKFAFISYQTIAPEDVKVEQIGATAVTLSWTPIPYASGAGGYQILASTSPGGSYTPLLTTASKEIGSATVTGLQPTTTYYFVVKAITFPFGNQLNTIFSDASAEVSAETIEFVASPARIVVAAYPGGIAQQPGVGGGTDSYTLTNIGGTTAQVVLTKDGDYFTQSPVTFDVAPGEIQTVTLTGEAQPEGWYGAWSNVWVDDAIVVQVWVTVFATDSVTTATTIRPLANRIDLSGPEGQNPTGQVRFRNDGNTTFVGVLVPDVDFVLPQQGLVTIEPGATFIGTVTADRSKRPDADSLVGSQLGKVSLRSTQGLSGKLARTPGDASTSPPVTASLVTVADTVTPPTAPGAPPPLQPGEVAVFVPRIGHALQAAGEVLSDLSITHSRGASPISDLSLFYSPLDQNITPMAATLKSLAAAHLVRYTDVVKSVFSSPDGFGTLQIRSSATPSLSVAASLFVADDPRGSFGTTIPAFRSDRAVNGDKPIILTGIRNDSTTSLYIQETSGATATATIQYRDELGNVVKTTDIPLAAFGLASATDAPPADASTMHITTDGGGIVAYATQEDEGSADMWTLADWSEMLGYDATEPVIIPVAAATTRAESGGSSAAEADGGRRRPVRRAGGGGGVVEFVQSTDISITNRCERVVDLREDPSTPCSKEVAAGVLRYHTSAGQTYEKEIDLGLRATVRLSDVIRTMFGVSENSDGYLEFVPTNGIFALTSRLFTREVSPSSAVASSVPVMGRSLALQPGQSRRLGGLSDSTESTIEDKVPGTTRTGFGLVEVSGESASVDVSVFINDPRALAAGAPIGTKRYELAPYEVVRVERMLEAVIGNRRNTEFGDLENVQIRFHVVGSFGAVIAYTMSVDNGTGDAALRVE